jgi:hypothetical protein
MKNIYREGAKNAKKIQQHNWLNIYYLCDLCALAVQGFGSTRLFGSIIEKTKAGLNYILIITSYPLTSLEMTVKVFSS